MLLDKVKSVNVKKIKRCQFVFAFALLATLLTSCNDNIDDEIPKNLPRLEHYHQKARIALKHNTIKNNNKIWISQPLYSKYKPDGKKDTAVSSFRVGFSILENNSVEIFVTNFFEYQSKSKDSKLFNNKNLYKVSGEIRVDFTILTKGILMTLVRLGVADFDYIMDEYSKEKITLIPYKQGRVHPRKIVLLPTNYNLFENYLVACDLIHNSKKYNSHKITLYDNESKVSQTVKADIGDFNHLIFQDYSIKNNELGFIINYIDNPKKHTYNFEVKKLVNKMKNLNISKLKISELKDNQVTFSTYGIKSVRDGKYSIILERG